MKKSYLSRYFFLLAIAGIVVTGCMDKSPYDPERVKTDYDENFPVDNVDANQDWKTVGTAKVNVVVNEDQGTNYRIMLFTDNPLVSKNNAKLLAQGYANNDMQFETTIDYPLALDQLYVVKVDENTNRTSVKPITIKNNTITTSFGGSTATTRMSDNSMIEEVGDYKTILTKAEVDAKLANATEAPTGYWSPSSGSFKVTTERTFTLWTNITMGSFGSSGELIIANKVKLNGSSTSDNLPVGTSQGNGAHIIIANGGELIVNCGIGIYGQLTVMPGGTLTVAGTLTISNPSSAVYNGGTVNTNLLQMDQAYRFYNYGDLECDKYVATTNGALVNRGRATIGTYEGNNNTEIQNGCHLTILEKLRIGTIKMGNNAAITCKSFVNDGTGSITMYMGDQSMFTATGTMHVNINVVGPTGAGEASLIRATDIDRHSMWSGSYQVTGNVIYELSEEAMASSAFSYLEGYITAGGSTAQVVLPGQAQITIEKDEDGCTGEGYTPEPGVEIPGVTDPEVMSYSYAFEDLYPEMGDYDFNDIVLDVAMTHNRNSENKVESTELAITLEAVGGTKEVGAALRLMGIDSSLGYVTVSFDDPKGMRNTLGNAIFPSTGTFESNTNNVIPLFGDAHKVYVDQYSYTGADGRLILNTTGNKLSSTYTLTVKFTYSALSPLPLIGIDNLDFFIGFAGVLGNRTEVHLYQWINNATPNGNVHDSSAEIAIEGNKTWAVCIPGKFNYPKEGHTITKVYPYFSAWAQNKNSNLDWYETVNDDFAYGR